MAIINKSTNNKCQWGCAERGTLLCCWWECRLVQPLWRAVWRYLKKLKMELPYDPMILFLGIYLKKPETLILKIYMHSCVHCSIIYNQQDLETAQVSISRWVDKKAMVHLHSGILLCHKKEGIWPFTTAWMELAIIMLSETSQSEKDKYHMISVIYGI